MLGVKINHLALDKSTQAGKDTENMLSINYDKLYRERALLKDDQPNIPRITGIC